MTLEEEASKYQEIFNQLGVQVVTPDGEFKNLDSICEEVKSASWKIASLPEEQLIIEWFKFDPESFHRISDVVKNNVMTLKDCAEILERIGPLCTIYTAKGFLDKFMNSRPFYFDFNE